MSKLFILAVMLLTLIVGNNYAAAQFHSFYRDCRILGVDVELAKARLALIKVTAHTIKHALNLLGVSATTSM